MAHVATVTIDNLQVSADLTDFVVLVDLSDLPASFWDVVTNGGGDIRCYKSDGTTPLAREVVSCDTATDTGELWVKYSGTLSSSVDTEIQIHADGTSSEPAVTDTYGRNAVWSDYVAVYHLSDTPTGSAGDIVDSAGSYDGNSSSMGAGNAVSGLFGVGGALDFDGSADHVRLGFWSEVGGGTAISVQCWSSPDALNDSGALISGDWNDSTTTDRSFMLSHYDTDELQFVTTDQTASNYDIRRSTNANLTTSGIYSFVNTWDTSDGKIYKNGSLLTGTWSGGAVTALGSTASYGVTLGSRYSGSVVYPFNGKLDEVRARMSVLSADWIATDYSNQSAPASFYTATAVGGGAPTLSLPSVTGVQATQATPQVTLTF